MLALTSGSYTPALLAILAYTCVHRTHMKRNVFYRRNSCNMQQMNYEIRNTLDLHPDTPTRLDYSI